MCQQIYKKITIPVICMVFIFLFSGVSRPCKAAKTLVPEVTLLPGTPTFDGVSFTLPNNDHVIEEFIAEGTATSYNAVGELNTNGEWNVQEGKTAPYKTRFVVIRPTQAERFNGMVIVEWLNVSGGLDYGPARVMMWRELARNGSAYVGVSAQKVGIDGGGFSMGQKGQPLKQLNPERYGQLEHPGDAYSFDMYAQIGRYLKESGASKVVFGSLVPEYLIAIGQSQSAFYMAGYVNTVAPIADIYDGYFVYSHGSSAAPPVSESGSALGMFIASRASKMRTDLHVPVFVFETETDVLGFNAFMKGFCSVRQPDTDFLRIWEIAGTAHVDKYLYGGISSIDDGNASFEELAVAWEPSNDMRGIKLKKPYNNAPQHHYLVQAAIVAMQNWIANGIPPAKAEPIELTGAGTPNGPVRPVLDENGNAKGGVRSPWLDVPTGRLSGIATEQAAMIAGSAEPFDREKLDSLYPGGKSEYLKKFESSLDESIKSGFILPEDKAEIMGIAALSYDTESKTSGSPAPAGRTANTSSVAADPVTLVDKAIRALGGAEKLGQVKAMTWEEKGTFAFQGNDIPFTAQVVVQGTDHIRREWNLSLSGMNVGGVLVVTGEDAWSKIMGNVEALVGEKLADERRRITLTVIPVTVLPLKSEGYALAAITDEQVGDRPAAGLKVTPPDGKEFRLYFDKETGLPVRLVAKVLDQQGAGEHTEETTFSDYQAIDGIQKATKISIKRDGAKSNDVVISEFKVLDRIDARTFEKLSASQPAAVPEGVQAQATIPQPRPITDPKVAVEALPDLKFNVYYPRNIMKRNTPVPVISWGNGGCMTFDWMSTTLLERWAAAGFVVVTYNDPAAKNQSLGVEALTAAQIRMLDWAEEANAEGGRFAGKLDTERMVVGGNSCGGVTAFNVAWADKRPKAIFIVSGSTLFPGVTDEVRKASAGRVELPTLYIVGGPEDIARTPVRLEYESLRPGLPAVLIERSSGDHVAVSNDPDIQRDEAAMAISWFRTILYGDKDAAKELATKGCAACDQKVWSVRSKNLPK